MLQEVEGVVMEELREVVGRHESSTASGPATLPEPSCAGLACRARGVCWVWCGSC